MKLIAYTKHGVDPGLIRPAPLERQWMDETSEKFAYRCLPLNIANQHGWEILTPSGFSASWNGAVGRGGITIQPDDASPVSLPVDHFGSGVLTFHVPYLFRTEPGYDLYIQGPVNSPKDGIAALSAVVETDWPPFPFTMNWKFTRPHNRVCFSAGDVICHFFPIKRGAVETFDPVIAPMESDPDLSEQYSTWSKNRAAFIQDLRDPLDNTAREVGWQKNYFQGRDARGTKTLITDHRAKVRLKPFRSLVTTPPV